MSVFGTISYGEKNTEQYETYITMDGEIVSPFHDVPLKNNDGTFNIIVEIPRWTNAKLEINTKSVMNPIKHDIKKGKVRNVANCFPYHGYIWNYGALPQTWECPDEADSILGLKGDNDPLDVIEIGSKKLSIGEIKKVKILGALAMIDEGELDWKIFCIDVDDEKSSEIENMQDVERLAPGLVYETIKWTKIYKIPDGKEINKIAFDEKPVEREVALGVIDDCHKKWKELVFGKKQTKLSIENTTLEKTPGFKICFEKEGKKEIKEKKDEDRLVFVSYFN